MNGARGGRPRAEWEVTAPDEALDRAIRSAARRGLDEAAVAARCCVSLQRVRRTLARTRPPAPVAAPGRRPGRREPAVVAPEATAPLARLAAFGGWVDPAVSLAGVPERVLAALCATGAIEVWPGRTLVRAVPEVAAPPATLPQQVAA
jgi:hypothetical protein